MKNVYTLTMIGNVKATEQSVHESFRGACDRAMLKLKGSAHSETARKEIAPVLEGKKEEPDVLKISDVATIRRLPLEA